MRTILPFTGNARKFAIQMEPLLVCQQYLTPVKLQSLIAISAHHHSAHHDNRTMSNVRAEDGDAAIEFIELWVPTLYWDDYSERNPVDHQSDMAQEMRRRGRQTLVRADAKQLHYLQSDARFYAEGNTDDAPSAVVRGAKKALEAINNIATNQMPKPHPATEENIISLLQSHRMDLSSEKRLQADAWDVLRSRYPDVKRECRLSDQDVPDFMIDGIVVEMKIRGKHSKMDIYRQLERYAKHPHVTSIILATNETMGLPHQAKGKPLLQASLSRSWM